MQNHIALKISPSGLNTCVFLMIWSKIILVNVHNECKATLQTRSYIQRWVSVCYMSHNPSQKASPLFDQSPIQIDEIQRA